MIKKHLLCAARARPRLCTVPISFETNSYRITYEHSATSSPSWATSTRERWIQVLPSWRSSDRLLTSRNEYTFYSWRKRKRINIRTRTLLISSSPLRNRLRTVICWLPGKQSSSAEPCPVKRPTAIPRCTNFGCSLRYSSRATVWNFVLTNIKPRSQTPSSKADDHPRSFPSTRRALLHTSHRL